MPRSLVYDVLKSWYKSALDYSSSEESQTLMKSFKKQIAQAITYDRPSRETSWKQSKEYNAMNKKMQTANSKLRRVEARLAGAGGRARARSRSRSRSRSPSSSGRSARRRSRYSSPSTSRERSARNRGREQSRARSVRHVSTGMSQMHGKVAANDPLNRMRARGFHRLCVHIM